MSRLMKRFGVVCSALMMCLALGACTEAEYEPCGGKSCGDTCTICDPDDKDCVETAVVKACDSDGKCIDTTPVCQ